MIETLLDAALRCAVLSAIVWLCLNLPRLRNPHIQLTAWTVVLVASLLMPAATRLAASVIPPAPVTAPIIDAVFALRLEEPSSWRVDVAVSPQAIEVGSAEPTPGATFAIPGVKPEVIAALLYMIAAGVFLVRMAAGLLLTLRLVLAAKPLSESWAVGRDIRVSNALSAPATFGATILLPQDYVDWSETKLSAVLAHETAHVRRGDFYIQIAAMFNRSIFWFNPLSWWLQRRLSELAEAASDDAALAWVKDRPLYAEILLELSHAAPITFGVVAMARPATVRARIERILAESSVPLGITKRARLILVAAMLPLAGIAASPLAARSSLSSEEGGARPEKDISQQAVFEPSHRALDFSRPADVVSSTAANAIEDARSSNRAVSKYWDSIPMPGAMFATEYGPMAAPIVSTRPIEIEAHRPDSTAAVAGAIEDGHPVTPSGEKTKAGGGPDNERRILSDEVALARFAATAPSLRPGGKDRSAGRIETQGQGGGKFEHVSDNKGDALSADISLAPTQIVASATPDVCDRAFMSFTEWNSGDPTGQRAFARCREHLFQNPIPIHAVTRTTTGAAPDICAHPDWGGQHAFLVCRKYDHHSDDVSLAKPTQAERQPTDRHSLSADICAHPDWGGQHAFYLCRNAMRVDALKPPVGNGEVGASSGVGIFERQWQLSHS